MGMKPNGVWEPYNCGSASAPPATKLFKVGTLWSPNRQGPLPEAGPGRWWGYEGCGMYKLQLEDMAFKEPEPYNDHGLMTTPLPESAAARKLVPMATGLIDYFPDALAAVAGVSYIGSKQHHPDEPVHWDRAKSTDESDALMRHFVDRGKLDTDGVRHSAKVAWRALALLQKEIEAARAS